MMSEMDKSVDGWNRRQSVDRRWQTCFPRDEKNEIRE